MTKTIVSLVVTHNNRLQCFIDLLLYNAKKDNPNNEINEYFENKKNKVKFKNCAIIRLDLNNTNRLSFSLEMIYEGEITDQKNYYFSKENIYGKNIPFPKIENIPINDPTKLNLNIQLKENTNYIFYFVRHGEGIHNRYKKEKGIFSSTQFPNKVCKNQNNKENCILESSLVDPRLTNNTYEPVSIQSGDDDSDLSKLVVDIMKEISKKPLSQTNGEEQSKNAGIEFNNYLDIHKQKIDFLFCSILLRTRQTIAFIIQQIDINHLKNDKKEIIVLPCSHELGNSGSNGKCDSSILNTISLSENKSKCISIPSNQLCNFQKIINEDKEYVVNWNYWNKDKTKKCTNDNMLNEAISIMNDQSKINTNNENPKTAQPRISQTPTQHTNIRPITTQQTNIRPITTQSQKPEIPPYIMNSYNEYLKNVFIIEENIHEDIKQENIHENIKQKIMQHFSIEKLNENSNRIKEQIDNLITNTTNSNFIYEKKWKVCLDDCKTNIAYLFQEEMNSTAYILRVLSESVLSFDSSKSIDSSKYISFLFEEKNIKYITGIWENDKQYFTLKIEIENQYQQTNGRLIMGFGPSASGKTYMAKQIIGILNEIDNTFPKSFLSIDGGIYREKSFIYKTVVNETIKHNIGGLKNLVSTITSSIAKLELVSATRQAMRVIKEGSIFDSNNIKKKITEYLISQKIIINLYVPETLGGCGIIKNCKIIYDKYIQITGDTQNWIGLYIWQHIKGEKCTYDTKYKCNGCVESGKERESIEGKKYSENAYIKSEKNGKKEMNNAPGFRFQIHNIGGKKYYNINSDKIDKMENCTSIIQDFTDYTKLNKNIDNQKVQDSISKKGFLYIRDNNFNEACEPKNTTTTNNLNQGGKNTRKCIKRNNFIRKTRKRNV